MQKKIYKSAEYDIENYHFCLNSFMVETKFPPSESCQEPDFLITQLKKRLKLSNSVFLLGH